MALHVDREQRFLHNILQVDSVLRASPSHKSTHDTARSPEKVAVSLFIPGDRGVQQPGKLVFIAAAQRCFLRIRLRAVLCYGATEILFKAWAITGRSLGDHEVV
jgi:hypothetical protein